MAGVLTIEGIKDLVAKAKDHYSGVHTEWATDERYFELDIRNAIGMPKELIDDAIVLPTGRSLVQGYVDQVDLLNARVWVNKKGTDKSDEKEAEEQRKFALGLLYRTSVESEVDPFHAAFTDQGCYGVGHWMHVWDAHRWPNAPARKAHQSEAEYQELMDEFRRNRNSQMPIVIQAINPMCVYPDWSYGGRQFVIIIQNPLTIDVLERYNNRYNSWSNPLGNKLDKEVELVSFWTPTHRCVLADGEPVIKAGKGIVPHNYGMIPLVSIEAGYGHISEKNDPVKRYVSITRYLRDVIKSESLDFSLYQVTCKKGALPWGTIEGDNASQVEGMNPTYGDYVKLPPGTKITDMAPKLAPEAVIHQMERINSLIYGTALPRSVQGVGETGVRSAVHAEQLASRGAARFDYPRKQARSKAAKLLTNCAYIQKRVIKEPVRMQWSRSPHDEFDVEIDASKWKEPITYYVEFSVSDNDQFLKNNDNMLLYKAGIITDEYVWKQMPDVNPADMKRQKKKAELANDPAVQAMLAQYRQQELAKAMERKNIQLQVQATPTDPMAQPPTGPMPMQEGPPRQVMAPSSPKPMPGGARDMMLQDQAMRKPMLPSGQGMGGGGNRR